MVDKEEQNSTYEEINCDCCNEISVPSSAVGTKNQLGFEDDEDEKPIEDTFINEKVLIIVGVILTATIVTLELVLPGFANGLMMLILATPVQILLGKRFYIKFWRSVKFRKKLTTDALVVLSTTIAYIYSLITIFTIPGAQHFFEASTSVLTIFTIGDYLERRVLRSTNESLKNLLALKPKKATVVRNGNKIIVDSDDIKVGEIVLAKPGEKIATDGVIVNGSSSLDESMITGESMAVTKEIGDKVIGGTLNKNGYIEFKAVSVGQMTVLANIIEIVRKARLTKAPVQRIADKAVQYFIPVVLTIAAISALYWLFIASHPISFAVTVFASVLVVSCPCALGIATPMVISLTVDKASRQGIMIKGGKYVEELSTIDVIVFDKTGTLTYGKPQVIDVIPFGKYTQFDILQLAASVETKSEHSIAEAIVNRASEQSITNLDTSEFQAIAGRGVSAAYGSKKIFVGNVMKKEKNENNVVLPSGIEAKIIELESQAKTVVGVFIDDNLTGLITVADTVRDNAKNVIDQIKRMNIQVILMSGDNERTARAIGKELGIDFVLAEVSPESKAMEISNLQNQGKKVLMVGDGINDAPALTIADVGIAMASGTDVAMFAGHVVLMKNNLGHIPFLLKLGDYALKKIKQNLMLSFAYNVITVSIAAGLLYEVTNSLILTPGLAALGWVISDTAVFGNSLLVRKC